MLGCKGLTENLQTRGKWKKKKLCVHAVYKKNKIIVITFMMLIHFLKTILALNQNKNCYKKLTASSKSMANVLRNLWGNKQQKQQLSHTIVDYFPRINNSK